MDIIDILKENHILLEEVFDSMPDGVVIADSQQNFLFWNKAARHILGNKPGKEDPKEWPKKYQLYYPETSNFLSFEDLPILKALAGESYADYRVLTKNINHPDGILLSVNGQPLRNGPATVGAITTFRNFTKIANFEKKLVRDKNFFERVLDLMPGIVFIKDLNGDFLYGNKGFRSLLGTNDIVGESTHSFLSKNEADKIKANDELVKETGIAHDFEERVYWDDGRVSVFRSTRFPYLDENSNFVGICCVSKDMTQEINDREAIEAEQAKNAQASKLAAIGMLAAEISHEIKNPLAIINTKTSLMKDELQNGETNKDSLLARIREIEKTVERLDKIIHSLSGISREAGGEEPTSFMFDDILSDVLVICQGRFKNQGVRFKKDYDETISSREITSYRTQIAEILLNLTLNSLDALEGRRSGVIMWKARIMNGNIYLQVRDNGPGISQELIPKVFEAFFTTKSHGKGTGLGLSVSKRIANSLNGDLTYQTDDQGHYFELHFPIDIK